MRVLRESDVGDHIYNALTLLLSPLHRIYDEMITATEHICLVKNISYLLCAHNRDSFSPRICLMALIS